MNYNKADFIASYGISSQLPESDRPELSFSGRSNVGKSSLINKLCSRKNLARVSSTPGKTATINFYSVDDCYFVDLPGYGYARTSKTQRSEFSKLITDYVIKCEKMHFLFVPTVSAGTTSSTATLKHPATTPCWCSCWTAATLPAPTMSRCCATCTITRSPTWWP